MEKYYIEEIFAITRCSFDKTRNIKEQRIEAVEKLEKSIGKNVDIMYLDVLILWDNLPKQNYLYNCLGYSEKRLIKKFCKRIKESEHPKLYISSPDIFTNKKNPDIADILKTIQLIWKSADIIPYFLEKNFIDFSDLEALEEEKRVNASKNFVYTHKYDFEELEYAIYMEESEELIASEIATERRVRFERFFKVVDNLLSTFNVPTDIKDDENFIDLYYMWQKEQVTGEYCLSKLHDISRASWYRYVNNFEQSPIYEETTIAYIDDLLDHRKKGILPDTFLFLNQFKKDNKEKEEALRQRRFTSSGNTWDCYMKFDEVHALIDVLRIVDSCVYKKNILKHKGLLNEKLKEYGFSEEDVFVYTELLS